MHGSLFGRSIVIVASVEDSRCILESTNGGSFTLPHGHGNFDNIFLAHPPSRVHNKVYETIVKMPEDICFELAPNHDVYMELFSGSLPDKDDIGLYFFPSFSHKFTSQP